MSGIQPLPIDVIDRIAAGEVIDSLAAVVRELIDNALDAGATRITISLWLQNWRVRVADNGSGMSLSDLQQAAAPHTTSKIHCSQDLEQVTSLGFRGEALHSLAQLSTLEICSRPAQAREGWRVVYSAQGQPIQSETIAIAPGTIVTVSELFQTWLSRRQVPTAVQQRLVQAVIHQSALCHPSVAWQVQHNDRPWFAIAPGSCAQDILPQVLPSVRPSDLQGLKIQVPPPEPAATIQATAGTKLLAQSSQRGVTPQLEVVLGLPDRCHRHRPDWVRVAVNGRQVQVGNPRSPELEQTIFEAFRQTLPRNRHPVCFVHLQVSPEQVDWHRHPAKTEVYLRHLNYWREQVAQAIARSLQLDSFNASQTSQTQRVTKLLKTAEAKGFYNLNRSLEASVYANGSSLTPLRAVAQIHQTYILAEHPTGLWLVEQHIAHERVLYEQLCRDWQFVDLEPPVILNQLSPAQLEQLQRLGISVDPFGPELWAARNAPRLLAQREDCREALQELSLGDLQAAQVATACRSAIRNGTPLNLEQMQTLLDQWQQTRHPHTCPHGRPIYLSLEESDLARFFRRHWVVGKSHGI